MFSWSPSDFLKTTDSRLLTSFPLISRGIRIRNHGMHFTGLEKWLSGQECYRTVRTPVSTRSSSVSSQVWPGVLVILVLWEAETGGTLGLTGCQPSSRPSKIPRLRTKAKGNIIGYPISSSSLQMSTHMYMLLNTHAYTPICTRRQ